jgi:hypothetical protein
MTSVAPQYYTPDLANRSLPLVRSIVEDVRDTAMEMEHLWSSFQRAAADDAGRGELEDRVRAIQERYRGLIAELAELGVELKDPFQGLLDFRAEREGHDVYLCWKLGEDRVGHWHELEAGFAGRQPMETF